MIIEIQNTFSKLVSSTDDERSWIHSYLTIRTKTFKRSNSGTIYLMNIFTNIFPTGFVPKIDEAARREGFVVEYHDRRVPPLNQAANADLSWLRDYQRAAVDAVWDCSNQIHCPSNMGRGILWLPTGAGKTEIACALALRYPIRWLFLVHRTNLMDQAAERFEKRSLGVEKSGRIGEGCWQPERFTAATFQTIYSQLSNQRAWLEQIQGVIFDEGHTLPSETFYRVAMALKNAYFRIAMSGTPLARGDKRSAFTVGATGSVLYRIKPDVLIDAGVLSRPTIRLLPVEQSSVLQTWAEVYRECVVESVERNKKIVEIVKRAEKPCLVFVKELRHGKHLEKTIRAAGINTEFVWGSNSLESRKAAIKRLVFGDTEVLIASVIFNEGVDIPELKSVVIGSGGKSVIAALQRIGRGMRVDKSSGKNTFQVWDIQDKGNRWLERHTRQRMRAYIGEGHETIVEDKQGLLL